MKPAPALSFGGAAAAAALLALALPAFAQSPGFNLRVEAEAGGELLHLELAEGDEFCLLWNHSVAGFEVADCFVIDAGRMLLSSSRQPDFAAGLGHVPGRGALTTLPGGGYLITGIDQPIAGNCLPLRLGAMAVDHRLHFHDTQISLSALAERQRVRLRLESEDGQGATRC